ncbi:hypothetical protein FQA39_LY12169 [Lamprigera yunnana]|nr:hypothetical protein FQA39_LY12169 [Lamprigera yunnana]
MNEIKAEDQTLTYVALENVQFNNMSFEVAHQEQINDLCRTCLTSATSFQSIFETNLNKMAMELTSVQITQGDGLPSKICSDCVLQIKQAYIFKQRVENSDNILRQHCLYIERVEDVDEPKNRYSEVNYEQPSKVTNFGWDCNELLSIQLDSDDEVVNDFSEDNCNSDIENEEKDILKTIESSINTKEDGNNIENENLRDTGSKECDIDYIPSRNDSAIAGSADIVKTESPTQYQSNVSTGHRPITTGNNRMKNARSCLPSLKHMKAHTGAKPYQCEFTNCGKSFKCIGDLIGHKWVRHIERRVEISLKNVCGIYETKWPSQSHMRTYTGEKPYKCDISDCSRAFTTMGHLNVHKKKHEERRVEISLKNVCGIYETKWPSQSHMRTYTGEKPYKCDISDCSRAFTTMGHLNVHKKKHEGQGVKKQLQHVCCVCGKKCPSQSHLTAHMRTHTGEKPYKCDISGCSRAFTTMGHLNVHKKKHEGQGVMKQLHVCCVCGKKCPSQSHLTAHMRTHTGEKPYKCDISGCSRAFTTMGHLNVHKKKHEGQGVMKQLHVCCVCGKKCPSQSHLTAHMRTHTGEKPYKCDISGCSRAFTTMGHLNVHKKKHEGQGIKKQLQHVCCVCGKKCPSQSHLTAHMRTHTGEKPYKCDISGCTRSFASISNLSHFIYVIQVKMEYEGVDVSLLTLNRNILSFKELPYELINLVCRICLAKSSFESIFAGNHIEMITAFTTVKISKGDGLPSQICSDCIVKIKQAYIFKKLVEKCDFVLKQRYLLYNATMSTDKSIKSSVDLKQSLHEDSEHDYNLVGKCSEDEYREPIKNDLEDDCDIEIVKHEIKEEVNVIDPAINIEEVQNSETSEHLKGNVDNLLDVSVCDINSKQRDLNYIPSNDYRSSKRGHDDFNNSELSPQPDVSTEKRIIGTGKFS